VTSPTGASWSPPYGAELSVSRETLDALAARHFLPPEAAESLSRLLSALAAESHPPTAIRDPDRALGVHVADSLSGLEVPELREASAIADVGSGAGFPGLVLAVALPAARVDLVESAGRKRAVIERLSTAAGAGNARAVTARAEEWALEAREAYDAVTARAVAPLAVLVEYASPLLRPGGVLVAWKGARGKAEEEAAARAAALAGLAPERVAPVTPFPGARRRHLHVYAKTGPTPDRLPRRPGAARKRPLG
jgi:16S rRNA (guanine527-N7)-methyltransferase